VVDEHFTNTNTGHPARPVGGNVWFKSKAWQSTQLIAVHLVKTFQVKLYTVLIVNVTYTAVQSACNDVKCNSVYCLVTVFSLMLLNTTMHINA